MKKYAVKRMAVGLITAMALTTVPAASTNLGLSTTAEAKAKISSKKLTLTVGSQKKLKVKGTTKKITWKSSKKTVASVTKKGVVTAKTAGTAVITAKIKGGKALKCKVTVKNKAAAAAAAGGDTSGNSTGTVYWVSGGSVYHLSKDCPSLSRSSNIQSGTVEESGRQRACKNCS